ncbi:hypothetical protein [Umezawaea tangerina]|uniref:hypothetical protein n=1 Tax=Umezawaea tangerina TaxID=84725 RepID=UPI000D05F036|nr:hypothetical protein [Umezawaea tangerina]
MGVVVAAVVLAACGRAVETGGGDVVQAVPGCGQRADGLTATGVLALTGRFPGSVERGGGTFAGTVTVTNNGQALKGDTSELADVVVVRDGKVVGAPLPKDLVAKPLDLPAGASADFPATGSLRECDGGEPLAAGSYQVFAVVSVNLGGQGVVAVGGPWSLDVT